MSKCHIVGNLVVAHIEIFDSCSVMLMQISVFPGPTYSSICHALVLNLYYKMRTSVKDIAVTRTNHLKCHLSKIFYGCFRLFWDVFILILDIFPILMSF